MSGCLPLHRATWTYIRRIPGGPLRHRIANAHVRLCAENRGIIDIAVIRRRAIVSSRDICGEATESAGARSTVSPADAFPRWSFLGRDKAIEPDNMTAGARRWWYHLPWRPRAPLRWVARTVVDQGSTEPVKLGDRVAATFELRLHDTTGCQTGCATAVTTGWMFVYTMQPVVQPVNRLYRVNRVYGSGWAQ